MKVKQNTIDSFIEDTLSGTNEFDLAMVLYQMFKDKYVCSSLINKKWYIFKHHRWEQDKGMTLRLSISKDMFNEYQKKQQQYMLELPKYDENDEKLKDIQAKQAIALDSDPNSNKSYWNNIKTKADGYSEFKKNWGSRENTDDWRRNEKTIVQPSMATDTTEKNNETANNPEVKDTLSVENLAKNLPLTDEQKLASLNKIVENQYTAGLIYKDLLQEQKLATQCFDDVINRKLNSDFQLLSAYQLYKMNEGKDSKKAQFYRVYILQNFPNSDYANYLKDVNFFVKKKEEEKK
jgi:hypothetical protein